MDQDFDQLRSEYIAALRPVVAEARRWWDAHCSVSHLDVPSSYESMEPFHRRWSTGPAGHPRVLEVFREFYFRTHDVNPMDFLINDLASIAPELFEVMQGLCFVPVGKNPMDNEEC